MNITSTALVVLAAIVLIGQPLRGFVDWVSPKPGFKSIELRYEGNHIIQTAVVNSRAFHAIWSAELRAVQGPSICTGGTGTAPYSTGSEIMDIDFWAGYTSRVESGLPGCEEQLEVGNEYIAFAVWSDLNGKPLYSASLTFTYEGKN